MPLVQADSLAPVALTDAVADRTASAEEELPFVDRSVAQRASEKSSVPITVEVGDQLVTWVAST